MANHPNRGPLGPGSNPSPEVIRDARHAAGLSQRKAAALIHSTLRGWQGYEADEGAPDHRRMHPGLWDLFRIRLVASERPDLWAPIARLLGERNPR